MKYVIIGNSIAAVGAVEAIRKNDKHGEIVIAGNENHHVYSRPLISYLLMGKTDEEKMKYRNDNFYKDNNCELKLNKTAVKIDIQQKQVVFDDGDCESYDKLLIAVGSSPFVPPVRGLDKVKNKFTFTALDDAKALEKVLNENSSPASDPKKVLIVGAGLIGLKCAEGISKKNVQILCVDLAPKVLSSILDDEGAEIVKKHLEDHHIKFCLKQQIAEFEENYAVLGDNTKVPFDVLVMAAGVRPNISLVKDIGGKTNRGILIDDRCRTSIPDIYAAGDCCESMDVSTGESKIMALLPNAYMQAECAGMNMSGVDYSYNKYIPMNAIGLFGKHIITAGTYSGDVYFETDGDNYKKLFYSDNKLNGYILIGNVEKAGIYTSLIREKTPLDSLDFELICKKPGLMAFSRETRAKKLGGVSSELASS
ncbi:MAG TPA: NAD(P)/FAD-dependent oxidoreductase [Clostridiaceae bacterium]|nr:NAD(P)/FAD-dependent oxidoreductase [Clostridiaceae bacterium]